MSTLSSVEFLKILGRGTYTLLIFVSNNICLKIGRLGIVDFNEGLYSYTGSALGVSNLSLYYRVSRHLKKNKKFRWHIDYLLNSKLTRALAVVAASSKKRFECKVSRKLLHSPFLVSYIPMFGSSDCNCPSHLHYFGKIKLNIILRELMRIYVELGLHPVSILLCKPDLIEFSY